MSNRTFSFGIGKRLLIVAGIVVYIAIVMQVGTAAFFSIAYMATHQPWMQAPQWYMMPDISHLSDAMIALSYLGGFFVALLAHLMLVIVCAIVLGTSSYIFNGRDKPDDSADTPE